MHNPLMRRFSVGAVAIMMFSVVLVACSHRNACASTLDMEPTAYYKTGSSGGSCSSGSSSRSSGSSSSSKSSGSSSTKTQAPSNSGTKTVAPSSSGTKSTVAPSSGTKTTTPTAGTKTTPASSKTVAPSNAGTKGKSVAPSNSGTRPGSKNVPVPAGQRPPGNKVSKGGYNATVNGTTHVYVFHNTGFYRSPGYRYINTDPLMFNDPFNPFNYNNPLSPWFHIHPRYISSSCY